MVGGSNPRSKNSVDININSGICLPSWHRSLILISAKFWGNSQSLCSRDYCTQTRILRDNYWDFKDRNYGSKFESSQVLRRTNLHICRRLIIIICRTRSQKHRPPLYFKANDILPSGGGRVIKKQVEDEYGLCLLQEEIQKDLRWVYRRIIALRSSTCAWISTEKF